ncbi:hypothetical protein R1flu_006979 [Riccia fluitans]|uniref:Uncharacterized protein n=1 Tax=Riccia fluitans TaxID=41844 RepID=A0ABD1YYE5_9MARC
MGADDAAVDNSTFHPRNGRANAEDAPLHQITNCLTMRQWRRFIGLCRMRRPTPETVLSSRRSRPCNLCLFARDAAGPQGQLLVNVSREGLKEYLDFPVFFSSLGSEDGKRLNMHAKLVIRQALKWIARPSSLYTSTTLVLLALAHVDPKEPNLKPDCQFLTRAARQNQEGPLLLGDELRNAFGDIEAQWDTERCELVCERDQLKEDLLKAQDVLADAAQREEALRAEHERLQEEYSQEKATNVHPFVDQGS